MFKLKNVNRKMLVGLFVLTLFICLIPFGIQAFATTDEAADNQAVVNESNEADVESTNPTTTKNLKLTPPPKGAEYELITKDGEFEYELANDAIITTEVKDHVGYIYVESNGVTSCYAIAFISGAFKQVTAWESTEESLNATTTFNEPTLADYTPDGYYYQMGQLFKSKDSTETLQGAEVSWVYMESPGTYITKYTNNLGFVCLKIPLGINGSTHVIAAGYVSDYSIPCTYTAADVPLFIHIDMMKGIDCTVKSNLSASKFHIHEYVSNSSIVPGLEHKAEDVYLSELPTRMLPDGAVMRVLSDEICDRYNLNHGSLYYYYLGKLPLGANLYEVVFEPDTNYQIDNWTLTDTNGIIQMENNKEYLIHLAEGPYVYQLNYKSTDNPQSKEPQLTQTAQTSDSALPFAVSLIAVIFACVGCVAYKKQGIK